eukprot:RCo022435
MLGYRNYDPGRPQWSQPQFQQQQVYSSYPAPPQFNGGVQQGYGVAQSPMAQWGQQPQPAQLYQPQPEPTQYYQSQHQIADQFCTPGSSVSYENYGSQAHVPRGESPGPRAQYEMGPTEEQPVYDLPREFEPRGTMGRRSRSHDPGKKGKRQSIREEVRDGSSIRGLPPAPARSALKRSSSTPLGPALTVGQLTVRVVGAVGIPSAESVGNPDPSIALGTLPLITLALGEEKHSTPVMAATPSLSWNWSTQFSAPLEPSGRASLCKSSLRVAVFSNGAGAVLLGSQDIDLSALPFDRPLSKEVRVAQGSLFLELRAENFGLPSAGLTESPAAREMNPLGMGSTPQRASHSSAVASPASATHGEGAGGGSGWVDLEAFSVTVVEALGLSHPAARNTSPYVVATYGSGAGHSRATLGQPSSSSPFWNETFEFPVDSSSRELRLEVLGRPQPGAAGPSSDAVLGRATLPLDPAMADELGRGGRARREITLTASSTGNPSGTLVLSLKGTPRRHAAHRAPNVSPAHGVGTMKIKVLRGAGLCRPGGGAVPSPLVRVRIGEKAIETAAKQHTGEPEFNEAYTFYVRIRPVGPGQHQAPVSAMEVTAIHKPDGTPLGSATLDLAQLPIGRPSELTASLRDSSGMPAGVVSLIAQPLDFGPALPELSNDAAASPTTAAAPAPVVAPAPASELTRGASPGMPSS